MNLNSTDKLLNAMHTAVTDAEELLSATASQTGERIEKARARAGESLRGAREKLQAAGRNVDHQIHEHPWTTAGIAAGLGLVVGILLGRRS